MDYQFEIVYQDTEAMCRQLYNRIYRTRCMVYAVCLAVFAVVSLSSWYQWGSAAYGFLGVLYLVGVPWFLTHPARTAKKAFKERLKYYKGQLPTTTARFGDELVIGDGIFGATVRYSSVTRVDFMEDIIVFTTADKKCYVTANAEFTKGSLPELRQFLAERCPQAKIAG